MVDFPFIRIISWSPIPKESVRKFETDCREDVDVEDDVADTVRDLRDNDRRAWNRAAFSSFITSVSGTCISLIVTLATCGDISSGVESSHKLLGEGRHC